MGSRKKAEETRNVQAVAGRLAKITARNVYAPDSYERMGNTPAFAQYSPDGENWYDLIRDVRFLASAALVQLNRNSSKRGRKEPR